MLTNRIFWTINTHSRNAIKKENQYTKIKKIKLISAEKQRIDAEKVYHFLFKHFTIDDAY